MLGIGIAYPVLPKLIQQFRHGDVSGASYLFGFYAAGFSAMQFLLAPLIGTLSDRFGRRPVLLLALAGSGIAYTLTGFAPNLWVLALARLIAGAMGGSFSTAGAYLADITPPEKRAQSFGLIGAAFGFGFITGPVIGGFLGAIDLRWPFLAAAALSFADLIFGWFALPESLSLEHRKEFNLARANPVGALMEMGRYSSVYGLMAVYVTAMFANRVAEMTWVLYTGYRFHWSVFETNISLALVGVMFVVGQGWFVRVVLPRIGERRAILLGLTVSVIVSLLYGSATKGWMVFAVMPLGICGWTMAQPAVQGLMSRAVPANEQGLLQGTVGSINSLTSIFGPPIWTGLFGFFVSAAAPVIIPGAAFYASAIVLAVALALAVRVLGAPASPANVAVAAD